jgi:hypothetical protein
MIVAARSNIVALKRRGELGFPNRSRFYDAARGAVLGTRRRHGDVVFRGCRSIKTASAEHAVQRNQPVSGLDLNRAFLEAAAIKIYARGLKGSYDLLIVDF